MNRKSVNVKKFCLAAFGLFFSYIFFFSLLVGDAELDGGDDFHHIAIASQLPWSRVLESVIFFKPNHAGYTSGGVMNYALSDRVGHTVAIKIIHDFAGSYRAPYFMAQRVMGALCLILLMYLVWALTNSVGWSIFAGFFYALLPMTFFQTIWLSDCSKLVHLFTLGAFALAYFTYRRYLERGRLFHLDFFLMVAALVTTFLAIKTKPSGLIIPAVFLIFGLWELLRSDRLGWLGMAGFLVIGFLSGGLILTKHIALFPNSFYRLVFQNINNEFESEKISAFFDVSATIPVSLARNINFFFLWLCVAAMVYLLFKRQSVKRPEVLFILLWFFLEITFYFLVDNSPRYLSDAFFPLICLICVLLQNAWRQLTPGLLKKFAVLWFLTGCIFSVINNFQHLVFVRNWKIGYFNELATPPQIIWNDLKGLPLHQRNSIEETVAFAWPEIVQKTRERLLPDFLEGYAPPVFFADCIITNDVVDLPRPSIGANAYRRYVISYLPDFDSKKYALLTSFRKVPSSPLVDFVSRFKKKKKNEKVYIYKLKE